MERVFRINRQGRQEHQDAPAQSRLAVHSLLRLSTRSPIPRPPSPDGGTTVPALPLKEFLGKRWAQSVLVDPSAAGGVDLAHIVEVDLVSVNDAGRVWVLDAASAPASLASVPDKRLAQVNLGTIEVPEGDEAAATARVPFTVSGDLDRRASFVVGLLSFDGSFDATTVDVDLAPGQTQGSVVVDYRGNRLDDAAKSRTQLVAFPRSGVMTDDYFGELAVLDDDPTPEVRVQAVHRNVREGEPAQIKVSLASRVGYFVEIQLDVVRGTGKGPRLSVGDVPRRWLRLHGVPVRWRTLIQDWSPSRRFVDTQLSGPYALWHHTHTFKEVSPNVTLMRDRVLYRLPFGILGRIAHALFVKRALQEIFDYRRQATAELLRPGGDVVPFVARSGALSGNLAAGAR